MSSIIKLKKTTFDFYKLKETFLHCRFLSESGSEHTCDVVGVSSDHVLIEAGVKVAPRDGDKIIMYIEQLGRVQGSSRTVDAGQYLIELALNANQKERFTRKLELLNQQSDELAKKQLPKKVQKLELADGSVHDCKVRGLSLWGVFLETKANPALDEMVKFGKLVGCVKRKDKLGLRIAFRRSGNQFAAERHFVAN